MIKNLFLKDTNKNFSILKVFINGGSNMDAQGKKGINQILSCLLTRGCKGFNNYEFSEFIDSHGAELNQEIYEDGIFITLKSLNEHFEKLYPLIDLIINEPTISKKQYQYIQKSTVSSIKKEKENPFNTVYEKWRKLVYKDHPYAFNCIGYEEDVKNISYQEILDEYKRFKKRDMFFVSNNSEVISNISNKSGFKDFENKFVNKSIFKTTNQTKIPLRDEKRFVSTYKNSNQIIIMLGNQTCSQFSKEYLPLKVLESYLSYGMSSLLFKLFREKNGLTYDVGVYSPSRRQNSPFLIYLSVSNQNAVLAFEILLNVWANITHNSIKEEEVKLAQEKLQSSFLISNQCLDEIIQRKIQFLSNDMNPNYDDFLLEKLKTVTAKQILKTTDKYLTKPVVSTYGNKKICDEIRDIWEKTELI